MDCFNPITYSSVFFGQQKITGLSAFDILDVEGYNLDIKGVADKRLPILTVIMKNNRQVRLAVIFLPCCSDQLNSQEQSKLLQS